MSKVSRRTVDTGTSLVLVYQVHSTLYWHYRLGICDR